MARLDSDQTLISVVVPAYNAQGTITDTLRSIQAQSHTALEVIVVDDGSRDGTAAIVEEFAAADPRFRLLSQENAGVAVARNTGWKAARSDLIAFVDADDLWSRDKLELQLAALEAAGPRAGLVYSRYLLIDETNTITFHVFSPPYAGDVLDKLITSNFVGNGSSALVRREALEAAGGFEPALHHAGAQGCEDILFYCRVAEHYEFAVVEDFQIGYRQLDNAMSANLPRMLRSWIMVNDEMREKHPERAEVVRKGLITFGNWTIRRAMNLRQFADGLRLVKIAASRSPLLAAGMLFYTAPSALIQSYWWKLPLAHWLSRRSNGRSRPPRGPVMPRGNADSFPVGSVFKG